MPRLDVELVNRGLFETRNKAQYAIENKCILVNNKVISKSSFSVLENDNIIIKNDVLPYVSKGGLKLEKAIKLFDIDLNNKKMVDIGSSTGGFSDCAIKNGIEHIVAIDVGSNQFSSKVLETNKVSLYENTDFRNIDLEVIKNHTIATIDVSFISVTMLLDKINETDINEIILLIKPQFECGAEISTKYKGVVLNKEVHKNVIAKVCNSFKNIGFNLCNLTYSPITGGNGNIEYLAYLIKETTTNNINYDALIDDAFKKLKK